MSHFRVRSHISCRIVSGCGLDQPTDVLLSAQSSCLPLNRHPYSNYTRCWHSNTHSVWQSCGPHIHVCILHLNCTSPSFSGSWQMFKQLNVWPPALQHTLVVLELIKAQINPNPRTQMFPNVNVLLCHWRLLVMLNYQQFSHLYWGTVIFVPMNLSEFHVGPAWSAFITQCVIWQFCMCVCVRGIPNPDRAVLVLEA